MSNPERVAPATLADLYLGCASALAPDVPIPHQLLADAVRALHGRGDALADGELEQARDALLARRLLRPGTGGDRALVLIDRKTARQAPASDVFHEMAREALETSLLQMVARAHNTAVPDLVWPQIDRIVRWSRTRGDAVTASLCTVCASLALRQGKLGRAADLLREALAIEPDPTDAISRGATLADILLRLGQPDDARVVMEQMAAPPPALDAARRWAADIAAARAASITPLPWSCVPDDLVDLLGGAPAFRDAYRASLRLVGGQCFDLSSQLVGPSVRGSNALVLPRDPATSLLARQRAAQAESGGASGDVKYRSRKRGGFLSHRPVPIITIGLTWSPQAFCVSASPAATFCSNRRTPSRSMFRAAPWSRS